jgi:hypothetical protein
MFTITWPLLLRPALRLGRLLLLLPLLVFLLLAPPLLLLLPLVVLLLLVAVVFGLPPLPLLLLVLEVPCMPCGGWSRRSHCRYLFSVLISPLYTAPTSALAAFDVPAPLAISAITTVCRWLCTSTAAASLYGCCRSGSPAFRAATTFLKSAIALQASLRVMAALEFV